MMGKEYRRIIALFAIVLVALNFVTDGSATESEKSLVRRKRNVICFFGLTGFISNVFYEALNGVRQLDPLVIGSMLNGLLQNVTFQGLSTLRNDTSIDVYCQNDMVVLNTLMSLSNVTFSCKWSIKVLFTFTGTVSLTVKDVQFQLDGTFNMNDGIVLDINVELTELDGMSLGFSGFGPLNPVIRFIGDIVLDIFQHAISRKLETVFKSALQSKLSKFQLSF